MMEKRSRCCAAPVLADRQTTESLVPHTGQVRRTTKIKILCEDCGEPCQTVEVNIKEEAAA